MTKAFEFITITTGSTTMSARSEVPDDVVRKIAAAMRHGGVLWGGFAVKRRAVAGGVRFEMLFQGLHVSDCWLCLDALQSDRMWEEAAGHAPDQVVLHRPRGVPWLAASLVNVLKMAAIDPMAMMALGDAERCIAWALIEMPGRADRAGE